MIVPIILAVAGVLLAANGRGDVLGMPAREAGTLLIYGAAAIAITSWAVERARADGRATVGIVVMWAIFLAGLAGLYAERETLMERARAIADEIGMGPPSAAITGKGEVSVTRRADGSFVLPGRINGHDTRFIFDTGATTVVLTAETAAAIGLKTEALTFRVPVQTANGRALAAPVTLDRVAVGDIAASRVFALVSAPGALRENLLGQSFLERLDSYEVRGRRLVLRAGSG